MNTINMLREYEWLNKYSAEKLKNKTNVRENEYVNVEVSDPLEKWEEKWVIKVRDELYNSEKEWVSEGTCIQLRCLEMSEVRRNSEVTMNKY